MDLVPSTSTSSAVCHHQRAFSLPQNTNLNVLNNNNQNVQASINVTNTSGKSFALQPVHQRTRSLPLTEETAIDFSQSPPNFAKFSSTQFNQNYNAAEHSTANKINNNSMDSIIEDYHNTDIVNNNSGRSNSIIKQLTKVANFNLTQNNVSSPSQIRKKRHHHNIMTASLRSTYHFYNKMFTHTNIKCNLEIQRDENRL